MQYRNPENIYLGSAVAVAFQNNVLTLQDKDIFQTICLNFLVECARLVVRFPFNSKEVNSLKHVTFLDPKNVKNTSALGLVSICFSKLVFVN